MTAGASKRKPLPTAIREDVYQMRPIRQREKDLRLAGILGLPKHKIERFAWRNDEQVNSCITKIMYRDFYYGYEDESNTVVSIFGPPGEGKSTVGKSLAIWLKEAAQKLLGVKNNRIFLSYGYFETIQCIKQASRGDIIIQDETKKLSAEGASTTTDALFNLLKNFRKKQICVIVISQDLKYFRNVTNFILYVDAKHRSKGYNRCLLLSGETTLPLGHVTVKVRRDRALDDYESRKDANIADIIETGGISVVRYPREQVDKHVSDVMEEMERRFAGIPLRKWKVRIIKTIIKLIAVPGDSSYRDMIADEVFVKIEKAKIEWELEQERKREEARLAAMQNEGVDLDDGEEEEEEKFDRYLRKVAANYLEKTGICKNGLHAKRWCLSKLNQRQLTYEQIRDLTGDKRADTVAKYIRNFPKLSNTHKGDILEIALLGWLSREFPQVGVVSSQDPSLSSSLVEGVFFSRLGSSGQCDLHLQDHQGHHLACINAKLKLQRRPSWTIKAEPEFENNPSNSFLALWSPERGLEVYKANQLTVNTGSETSTDIGLSGLVSAVRETLVKTGLFDLLKGDPSLLKSLGWKENQKEEK